ncbi:MAG TPA: 50S ribosomal protein L24 [Phycisphaerae bacterium]|nr:50S ribosomal protein L24 [Phycisphaerae bacterium]HRW53276.1 50S ribosomal protein L24 [Phycisphaerae bacterium]
MAAKVRKGDRVEVISGEHRGQQGKVLRVEPTKDRVYIEGVNLVHRHMRPSRKNPQGGRIQKEAPIHISNVLPVDPKTGRGSRVRFETEKDARGRVTSKRRVTVGGTVLDEAKASAAS